MLTAWTPVRTSGGSATPTGSTSRSTRPSPAPRRHGSMSPCGASPGPPTTREIETRVVGGPGEAPHGDIEPWRRGAGDGRVDRDVDPVGVADPPEVRTGVHAVSIAGGAVRQCSRRVR